MSKRRPPTEVDLLDEVARLTAALIRVVNRIDDPVLKAEIAELVWPRRPIRRFPLKLVEFLARARKAVTAGVVAGVPLIIVATGDGTVDAGEVRNAFIVGAGTAVIVWLVPNKQPA